MTYETVSRIVQQGGTVYFAVMFAIALTYALRPGKRDEFDRAARLPLDDDGL